MEKRLLITIALSLAVLIFWSTFVTKPYHIENKEDTLTSVVPTPPPISPKTTMPSTSEKEPTPENLLTFKQKKFDLVFVNPEASVQQVVFKDHQSSAYPLKHGFLLGNQAMPFVKTGMDATSITFNYEDGEKNITKKYTFSDDSYAVWLSVKIRNTSTLPIKVDWPLEVGQLDFSDNANAQFIGALVKTDEKAHYLDGKKNSSFANISFAGLKDRYFCTIISPSQGHYSAGIEKINGKMSKLTLYAPETSLASNQEIEIKFHIYMGPQQISEINKVDPAWGVLVNYGTFDIISQILLKLLNLIHMVVRNWGWAIVILSILVYLCLYPLTLKQMRSMKEMQLLQPHIEELKAKYKDNAQKLNKEIMELYRQHKVNPFGGCLPLLLQMPIFFALYQALMRSIVLKGAKFLWIKDLSQPDRLFIMPFAIPFLGNEFNLLPIVMAIGMFFQQKISISSTSVGAGAEQQKMMLILFPIIFGFIFYHMPAGLVLYWLTNSILTVSYQFKTRQLK